MRQQQPQPRTASLDVLGRLPPTQTLGGLVDFADGVPRDLVLVLLPRYFSKLEELIQHDGAGGGDEAEVKRNLVVAGTLINRALFEVFDLPQDREFVIR